MKLFCIIMLFFHFIVLSTQIYCTLTLFSQPQYAACIPCRADNRTLIMQCILLSGLSSCWYIRCASGPVTGAYVRVSMNDFESTVIDCRLMCHVFSEGSPRVSSCLCESVSPSLSFTLPPPRHPYPSLLITTSPYHFSLHTVINWGSRIMISYLHCFHYLAGVYGPETSSYPRIYRNTH